eukprot:gnl/MRDRNA2_/MRDRNA2_74794_c0_seq1.p1 gnl/MRDRNA2_/MRDRNA2_74794_c0~~gnl/MRDRNA2_/MRDRNA2_74794_c0_seq1.p1  ORF type:complete len:527 (-),score=94.84 gnl/MRDRNA2_/MRDRNA2_74794_c0_seq1:155-1735(-)
MEDIFNKKQSCHIGFIMQFFVLCCPAGIEANFTRVENAQLHSSGRLVKMVVKTSDFSQITSLATVHLNHSDGDTLAPLHYFATDGAKGCPQLGYHIVGEPKPLKAKADKKLVTCDLVQELLEDVKATRYDFATQTLVEIIVKAGLNGETFSRGQVLYVTKTKAFIAFAPLLSSVDSFFFQKQTCIMCYLTGFDDFEQCYLTGPGQGLSCGSKKTGGIAKVIQKPQDVDPDGNFTSTTIVQIEKEEWHKLCHRKILPEPGRKPGEYSPGCNAVKEMAKPELQAKCVLKSRGPRSQGSAAEKTCEKHTLKKKTKVNATKVQKECEAHESGYTNMCMWKEERVVILEGFMTNRGMVTPLMTTLIVPPGEDVIECDQEDEVCNANCPSGVYYWLTRANTQENGLKIETQQQIENNKKNKVWKEFAIPETFEQWTHFLQELQKAQNAEGVLTPEQVHRMMTEWKQTSYTFEEVRQKYHLFFNDSSIKSMWEDPTLFKPVEGEQMYMVDAFNFGKVRTSRQSIGLRGLFFIR